MASAVTALLECLCLQILHGVSVRIEPGTSLAFVGSSGSGGHAGQQQLLVAGLGIFRGKGPILHEAAWKPRALMI